MGGISKVRSVEALVRHYRDGGKHPCLDYLLLSLRAQKVQLGFTPVGRILQRSVLPLGEGRIFRSVPLRQRGADHAAFGETERIAQAVVHHFRAVREAQELQLEGLEMELVARHVVGESESLLPLDADFGDEFLGQRNVLPV